MNNQSPFRYQSASLADGKYRVARYNLLLLVIFTTVNIIISMVNGDVFFLFSAMVPYFFSMIGACGFYVPEESGMEEIAEIIDPLTFMIVMCVIAVVLTVPYLLCWAFSKKHYGWMIAALVMFSLDSLFMLLFFDLVEMIINILGHAWVLYYLIMGVRNGIKVKKEEKEAAEKAAVGAGDADAYTMYEAMASGADASYDAEPTVAVPLRSAEAAEVSGQKVKVLVKAEYEGRMILYRKVGKTEELVIDGNVFAELDNPSNPTGWSMGVMMNGHKIEAGVASSAYLIVVDDKIIARATKWF